MKKTFEVRITLADGAVHIRKVSACSAVELFDRIQALTKEFPTYVRSESACLALRRCTQCGYYPFAPGAIEHLPRRRLSKTTRITVVRAALVLVVLGSMAAMGSLLTGGLL